MQQLLLKGAVCLTVSSVTDFLVSFLEKIVITSKQTSFHCVILICFFTFIIYELHIWYLPFKIQ
jgi:hypothetical protein